jgi:glycosyltransferase involved in cell wall biosynthesis
MDLTGVVVSYKNKDLLERSYNSVKKFYPDLEIIIVDSSPEGSECRKFIDNLDAQKVLVDFNISHGRGLHLGITISPTNYVLCFDNDIEVLKPPIEEMLKLIDKETWGVGRLVDLPQENWRVVVTQKEVNLDDLSRPPDITYMHPFFHIVNRHVYRKYLPYLHSAAPGQVTFLDIASKNDKRILKDFPVHEYVKHYQGSTSKKSEPSHLNNWVLQTEFFPLMKKKWEQIL